MSQIMEIQTKFSEMVTHFRLKFKLSFCEMDDMLSVTPGTCEQLECSEFPLIPVDQLFDAITILRTAKKVEIFYEEFIGRLE